MRRREIGEKSSIRSIIANVISANSSKLGATRNMMNEMLQKCCDEKIMPPTPHAW
jgi:hypothetical protein